MLVLLSLNPKISSQCIYIINLLTQRLVLRFINLSDSSYICTLIIDSTQGMYISVIGWSQTDEIPLIGQTTLSVSEANAGRVLYLWPLKSCFF